MLEVEKTYPRPLKPFRGERYEGQPATVVGKVDHEHASVAIAYKFQSEVLRSGAGDQRLNWFDTTKGRRTWRGRSDTEKSHPRQFIFMYYAFASAMLPPVGVIIPPTRSARILAMHCTIPFPGKGNCRQESNRVTGELSSD
jgi:hypothetical protein